MLQNVHPSNLVAVFDESSGDLPLSLPSGGGAHSLGRRRPPRPSPSLSCPCPQDVAATTTLTMMMLMEARWHLAIKASETFRPDICISDWPFCEISPPRSFSAGCLSCCARPAALHLPELAKSAFISSQFPSSISVDRPLAAAPPPLLCRYFLSCFLPSLPSLPLLLSQTSRWCTYIL